MNSKPLQLNRRQLCAALALVSALPASMPASVHAKPAPRRLLVLGDSLSAEYGIAPGSGWVALLARQPAMKDWDVVNASVSGETSAGGASRLPALLRQHQPTWLILQLGSNDALRGLSLDALERQLTQMIQAATAAGAKVMLIGAQMPGNYGAGFNQSLLAVYERLARQHRLPWMPHLLRCLEGQAQPQSWLQPDQLHPLAKAHPLILKDVMASWPVSAGGSRTRP